ncbi:hypothetical protein DDZ14_10260 [Maritimibacter sp. 55A14]|nr:hypothetical protein DDZ14_10260 [Maritimibacter sp. 55A14]
MAFPVLWPRLVRRHGRAPHGSRGFIAALPQVPFHKLPELHDRMAGWHKVLAEGYAEFSAGYASHLR